MKDIDTNITRTTKISYASVRMDNQQFWMLSREQRPESDQENVY